MLKFGEIVVDEGYATDEDIETALEDQKSTDILLGKVLVDMHKMTRADADRVAEFLKRPEGRGKKFGQVAVFLDFCPEEDIEKALDFQKTSKGLLGDLLIALGYLTSEQREEILKIQFPGG